MIMVKTSRDKKTQSISLSGRTTETRHTSAIQDQSQSVYFHYICSINTNGLLEVYFGQINDDTQDDTGLVGKIFIIINTYDYAFGVGVFTAGLDLICLDVVNDVAVERTGDDYKVIIRINQAFNNPN